MHPLPAMPGSVQGELVRMRSPLPFCDADGLMQTYQCINYLIGTNVLSLFAGDGGMTSVTNNL